MLAKLRHDLRSSIPLTFRAISYLSTFVMLSMSLAQERNRRSWRSTSCSRGTLQLLELFRTQPKRWHQNALKEDLYLSIHRLFINVSVRPSIYLYIYLSTCLWCLLICLIYLSTDCLSAYLSICLATCLAVYLSICLSIYLFV